MRAPNAGNQVQNRQRGVGILGDVGHGKIVYQRAVSQAAVGNGHEQPLPVSGWPGDSYPAGNATERADDGKEAQHQRQAQGEDEGEVAEFGNHGGSPCQYFSA